MSEKSNNLFHTWPDIRTRANVVTQGTALTLTAQASQPPTCLSRFPTRLEEVMSKSNPPHHDPYLTRDLQAASRMATSST